MIKTNGRNAEMSIKPKLAVLRRKVEKLLAAAPKAGQGSGWLALYRLDDLVSFVAEAIPPDVAYPRDVALGYVVLKESQRLGIAADPALVTALGELHSAIEVVVCPPVGAGWEERSLLEDAVRDASVKAAGLILSAWGVSPGPLGPPPPGGRPPRESLVLPPWLALPTHPAESEVPP
jgi:hypothetical protein